MSATKIGLDPEFATKLNRFEKLLADRGIKVIMTDAYRSILQQDNLYAKGRTIPGKIVTKARGGYSWHNFRLAADYAFVINGKVTWNGPWAMFGKIARECGLEWGGSWKSFPDKPHVQWTRGKTLAEMRQMAKAKTAGK
jgi:peptidoglycan L-alanyl-D-glutamate endopeptidase CwlK